MNTQEVIDLYQQYVMPTYTRWPICFDRGEGSYVWDLEGNQYIDFFPGWAVSGLGHCHPILVQSIKSQLDRLLHMPNNFFIQQQALLAQKIVQFSFKGKCFFANSGAESVEAAIKCARRYHPQKYKIISMKNSFHGRTFAAMTATGQPIFHEGYEPLVPGVSYVAFNQWEELIQAIDNETAAIILEPIQGEGGVHVAQQGYLENIRNLCHEKDICLIFDEVQTGMGRTGQMFAYQYFGIEPDIMCLAKNLGGGVSIGAIVAKDKFIQKMTPGSHASTFGGNPIACTAALSVFQIIEQENILQNVQNMGQYLKNKLITLHEKFPELIKEVRGIGLMLGVEFHKPMQDIIQKCLEKKIILNCTKNHVIRFMPALNVNQEIIDQVLKVVTLELEKI